MPPCIAYILSDRVNPSVKVLSFQMALYGLDVKCPPTDSCVWTFVFSLFLPLGGIVFGNLRNLQEIESGWGKGGSLEDDCLHDINSPATAFRFL